MIGRAALLVALVLQATPNHPPPLAINPPAKSCTLENDVDGIPVTPTHHPRVHYQCAAIELNGQPVAVSVDRRWFRAHCHVASNVANGGAATCDAYADPNGPPSDDVARPPHGLGKVVHGVKNHALYVLIGAAVVACVASGGCAALGGGA